MKLRLFKQLVPWLAVLVLGGVAARAASLPPDVLSEFTNYNVTWTSPSTNGSPGSMPIGNGDITANVWVENNGGDLVLYIGKSDSWSESTRLLKIGRTRLHFTPNPFAAGSPFAQTLDFYHGEIDITAGQPGSQVSLRLWADANQPVIRIEAGGQQSFTLSCSNEIWRTATQTMTSSNSGSFYGVQGAAPAPAESPDVAPSLPDRLVWFHQNNSSYFKTLFQAENLGGYAANFNDPWTNRIFGATIFATNFTVVNSQQLQSAAGTNFLVSIYPYTAQPVAPADWQLQMSNLVAQVNATDLGTARTNHYHWWDAFWNRSWIFVSGDANATNVTRGYLEQRFMTACQGRGQYPIKFNGGTFTFDYNGQNGDYRAWGPSYWNQNTRLLYWPLLAAGDFDLMLPFFNSYTNMLPVQMAATTHYYGHGGAFFPETFNIFGLYNGDNWGWNNATGTTCGDTYITYHYQGGLETLAMMLNYYDYTQDSSFATNYVVPFATQVIRFFNEHWPRVNGQLFFYPANACETYWSCTNSADYISGLQYDISKLVALPAGLTTPALLNEWTNCYAALPPLPMDPANTYIKPAQTYGAPHNVENPECYCIFPYRLYGFGQSNLNVALATFNHRMEQSYKSDWSQDVIQEPLVGLIGAAQADLLTNFADTDPAARFQAFWTSRSDYLPCEDTGGAAMSGLQFMLLQPAGNQLCLLPAWPPSWNVDFQLCAPGNTTVRLVIQNQSVSQLTVNPPSRTTDLVEAMPPAPTGLMANAGNTRVGLNWAATSGAGTYNVQRATVSGGPYTTVAPGVTGLSYLDTGLVNGATYYYVVSAGNVWGQGANSAEVAAAPGTNYAVHWEGDLIANLQSADLTAGSKVWTNRTSNPNGVGNLSTVVGGSLNIANVAYGTGTIKALFVNQTGNNSVISAALAPSEITGNHPVSVDAWVYPVDVNPTSCYVGYGYQGGSSSPMVDREFNYDTSGHGVISGDFGSLDTGWNTPPTAGTWHYLAVTYDGTNLLAYLDGNLDVTHTIGTPIATGASPLLVGSSILGTRSPGNDPFHGYIACARVASGVLTADDIAINYLLGPLATATATVPAGLAATPGDGQVSLQWNVSSNAVSYNLKRSAAAAGPFSVIASKLTTPGYTNTGLTNGTLYYYAVSATNSAGESANSPAVAARPVSLAVPQLQFSLTAGQLQLNWPADHTGWILQAQTNAPNIGLTTNWYPVSLASGTNQLTLPVNPGSGNVFFRLVSPW